VLLEQVLGPELAEPRMVDKRPVRLREGSDGEGDLPPEAGAGRVGSRVGRAQ